MRARYCKPCSRVVWSNEPCCHGVFNDSANANFSPVVVFRNAKGEVWIPPHTDARPEQEGLRGYRREELADRGQVDRFTKELDAKDKKTFAKYEAKRQERMGRIKEHGIGRLLQIRARADGEGRATIDAAIEYVRSKDVYSKSYDPGNHIKAFE